MSGALRIVAVRGRQILDSRAAPTVEATVELADGTVASASSPSGASTGRHEAHELRDGGPHWVGRGVTQAARNVAEAFGPALAGLDAFDQRAIDERLRDVDGTTLFSRLGANAALAISVATARAAAAAKGEPLFAHLASLVGTKPCVPLPMVNMISGGAHAGGNIDIQDVLVVPAGAETYGEALEMLTRIYWALRALLIERGHPPLVGDEGGFGPRLASSALAIEHVIESIERAELRPGRDVFIALDVAATQFWNAGRYRFEERERSAAEMTTIVERWLDAYPIVSVEDPLAEDDWDGWAALTRVIGGRTQLVGDDLFTTNVDRIRRGVAVGAANAVLIKANQIGTLWDAIEALRLARESGYGAVISARSGETEDDWLADWAVATGAGQIKVGSIARSERLAKYNRLLRIEEDLPAYWSGRGGLAAKWRPKSRPSI